MGENAEEIGVKVKKRRNGTVTVTIRLIDFWPGDITALGFRMSNSELRTQARLGNRLREAVIKAYNES